MCGIVGVLGQGNVAPTVFSRLTALEYRGYDSAGIATLVGGELRVRRAAGKLTNLAALLDADPIAGASAIGHTRWATHGPPTDENAHPHSTGRVAVVHNGIIENHSDLRARLEADGVTFSSQTDTEVVARYVAWAMESKNLGPDAAVAACLGQIRGAFALAFLFAGEDDLMIAARKGSPLVVGRGEATAYAGSDAYALAGLTNAVTYLHEGDMAVLRRGRVEISDRDGAPAQRPEKPSTLADVVVDKGGHRHFMAKEIAEQPDVVGHTLARYVDATDKQIVLDTDEFSFANIDRMMITACGTAFYAGSIARYWFEKWAGLSVDVDIASELRYRDVPYARNGAAIFVSQSGETADTLAALANAKANGQRAAAIVNVPESTIAREADVVFPTAAGPEIGVASTKAFTCQLATLACLAIAAGRQRGVLSRDDESGLIDRLLALPRLIAEALAADSQIEEAAATMAKARDILYIGRGVSYPLAMEGALKLKEISYIHAEGYAAGELKHGPIALIDEETPVIAIAPSDRHFAKTMSNVEEVVARGGVATIVTDAKGAAAAGGAPRKIIMPDCDPMLTPLVNAIPMQLIAYHTAVMKGTDVDQPRNLAKSVTVE